MATVTFQRPVQMSSYPITPTTSGGSQFSTTQIAAWDNVGTTGYFFGNFTFDIQTAAWIGTVTRVAIGTNNFLDLDITNFSLTTTARVDNFLHNGIGNFLPIVLAGNDTFIGTAGADGFIGYDGNDTVTYSGASAGIIADLDAGGLTGDAAGDSYVAIENLTGTNFADFLIGNVENNIIDGAGGADIMEGEGGNDRYYVQNPNEKVIEAANEGTDHVVSSVSFSLAGQYIEWLTLTGTANINGTGNSLANKITGNSGNNVIRGYTGLDTLFGKDGNDTFVFNSAAEAGVGATRDVIRDFEDFGDNETIDLSGFAGTLIFSTASSLSGALNEVIARQSGDHVLIQINSAAGGGAEAEILLANTLRSQITASDFDLV